MEGDNCLFKENNYLTGKIICSIIKYRLLEPTDDS